LYDAQLSLSGRDSMNITPDAGTLTQLYLAAKLYATRGPANEPNWFALV